MIGEVDGGASLRRAGPWYGLAIVVLRPLLMLLTRRNWRGAENLPPTGGFVAAVNHVSFVDPFTFAHFMYDNGHLPRFLIKASIFRLPFVGRLVTGAGQIPVDRHSASAASSYRAAVDAVRRGECVAIYPEGTLTKDPQMWPMRGRTGAVRVALETGCPVVPVAQWGAQAILPPYSRIPRLLPRHDVEVSAGRPVDLTRFRGRPVTAELLREATDAVMADVTQLLAGIRGLPAPAHPFEPQGST